MAFVKFEKSGMRMGEPKIAIWKRGQININRTAAKMYKVDNFKYCVLYYDSDEKKVGFQLTNDGSDTGAIKINKRKDGSCVMSGVAFLKHFRINYGETINYPPEYDASENMIIIKLSNKKK